MRPKGTGKRREARRRESGDRDEFLPARDRGHLVENLRARTGAAKKALSRATLSSLEPERVREVMGRSEKELISIIIVVVVIIVIQTIMMISAEVHSNRVSCFCSGSTGRMSTAGN